MIVKGYYKMFRVLPDPAYLCFENTYNGSNTVTISRQGTPNATNIEYSKDKSTWTEVDLTRSSTTVSLSTGEKLYFRGVNENGFSKDRYNYLNIKANNTHNVSGNIMSLLDYQNIDTVELHDYDFCSLFNNNNKLVDASRLQLPATTLVNNCYQNMFSGCTSLTTAPELPATTLANSCYLYMFIGCTSLTTAPTLLATTLANYCYSYMFYGCTSLTDAPELPATTLLDNCYSYMFYGCTSLNYVKVGATNWSTSNAGDWLNNVATTGTVEVPTGCTIPSDSVSGVPTGWTKVEY